MFTKSQFYLRLLALLVCIIVAIGMFQQPMQKTVVSASEGELRGIWISTVANIDYPSKQTTDPELLKQEIIHILDHCKSMGFNAVFFQVRPAGDALYRSEIFPWSRYLTGTQGVAPQGGFDPLAFAVEEAHQRNMELHAWINPYRITSTKADNSRLAQNNPAVLHPELVITDATGKMYYNPGKTEVIQLIVDGAVEIVKNYDVDGVHMDDYFYPDSSFDDEATYSPYREQYPNKDDWRRAMVNQLVMRLNEAVHAEKPDVAFGISPRGVWANDYDAPGGSKTRGGGSYNTVFADSKAWIENGWVDYIMPQIYWYIGYEPADYLVLCDWWSEVVRGTDVKLYIGEGAYRTVSDAIPAWTGESGIEEMRRHIEVGRGNDTISGYCMFTYNNFVKNLSLDTLMKEVNFSDISDKSNQDKEEEPTQSEPILTDKPLEEPVTMFVDMKEYPWAINEVNTLAEQGIIQGQSETMFAPATYITRADNTVLLMRVLEKNVSFRKNFDDVSPDSYYYNEVGMAKELGFANGDGDGRFYPTDLIKRQDMATLAYRILSSEGVLSSNPNTAVLNKYKDKSMIDSYALDAMAACVEADLISGYGDGVINPQGNATRVEVAIFIYRIFNLLH